MIEGKGQLKDRSWLDTFVVAGTDDPGGAPHSAYGENCGFARVEDRCAGVYAEHTDIADGRGAAGHRLSRSAALTGCVRELCDGLREVTQAESIRALDVGHNEPAGCSRRNAEIDLGGHHDLLCVLIPTGIGHGGPPECMKVGAGHER